MIEDYQFGELRHAGKTYRSDVIIFGGAGAEERVRDHWWRKQGHRLDPADLAEVVKEKPEVLVVGTGYYGRMEVPQETLEFLRSLGIELIAENTSDACHRFNEIQSKSKVAAALHLTC